MDRCTLYLSCGNGIIGNGSHTVKPCLNGMNGAIWIVYDNAMKWKIFQRYWSFVRTTTGHRWIFSTGPVMRSFYGILSLQWRHNVHDGVSNHRLSHMFDQLLLQAQIKENIKAPRHWPLCGEFTGGRWIPRTKGQKCGKCFHLMTSSWLFWTNSWTNSQVFGGLRCHGDQVTPHPTLIHSELL